MEVECLMDAVGFTIADLIADEMVLVSNRDTKTFQSFSIRLYESLQAKADKTGQRYPELRDKLLAEYAGHYVHKNGPVAVRLGFTVQDLGGQYEYHYGYRGVQASYAMSSRLHQAIRDDAAQRGIRGSTVFRELQAELLGRQ